MKKLLGISLVAVLTATPLMASAADRVPLVTPEPTPNTNVASTSYVQGAYNVLGKAINAIDTDLSGNYATKEELSAETNARTNADTTLQNNIDTLSSTVATKAAQADLEAEVSARETLAGRVTTAEGAITTLNGDAATAGSVDYKIAQSNTTLNNAINNKADKTALEAEVTARQDADTALGNRVTTAEGAITTLNGNAETAGSVEYKIAQSNATLNEAINKKADKTALEAEVTARTTADTALQTAINTKANSADVYTKTEADARFDATGAAATAETNAKAYADAKVLNVYTTWGSETPTPTKLSNPAANPAA